MNGSLSLGQLMVGRASVMRRDVMSVSGVTGGARRQRQRLATSDQRPLDWFGNELRHCGQLPYSHKLATHSHCPYMPTVHSTVPAQSLTFDRPRYTYWPSYDSSCLLAFLLSDNANFLGRFLYLNNFQCVYCHTHCPHSLPLFTVLSLTVH